MRWGPPAQPSQLPEADPRRAPLLGGRGGGGRRRPPAISDSPRPWRASGVGVRAFAPSTHPPARAFRVWRSPAMSPGRARIGRLLAVRAFASASSAPWAPVRASASGAYAPL